MLISKPKRSSVFLQTVTLVGSVILPGTAWAAPPEVQLFVPLGFFACVAIVAGLIMVGYHRATVQKHQTLRALIEKGMQVPPELLSPSRPPNRGADVRRGILLLATGVGIALFLLLAEGAQEAALGLVPAFVGIGYLVLAKLANPPPDPAGSSEQPSPS